MRPSFTAKQLTWRGVRDLADLFGTSVTAAAIRVIDLDIVSGLLVCHNQYGRRWFRRSKSVPERWFPQDQLDADSYALDVLHGKMSESTPHTIDADSWFDRSEAARYQLVEDSIQVVDREVLTLLTPKQADMLDKSIWSFSRQKPYGRR